MSTDNEDSKLLKHVLTNGRAFLEENGGLSRPEKNSFNIVARNQDVSSHLFYQVCKKLDEKGFNFEG